MVAFIRMAFLAFMAHTKAVLGQSCTDPLPMPPNADQDRDSSGLRPSRQPPIPVGGALTYDCPQMKSINGKTSFGVKCNDLEDYVFPSDLRSWHECQCSGDLTSQCPGLGYKIAYVYRKKAKPSMTFTIPQDTDTTGWTIDLKMDMDVNVLHIRSSHAVLALSGHDAFSLKPLSNHDFEATSANVTVNFYFDNRDDIASNDLGEIPRWRYPCVSKVSCTYEGKDKLNRATIWLLIGVVGGTFIIMVCLCACCNYCMQKHKAKRAVSTTTVRTVSTIEDWQNDDYFQHKEPRRTTPKLEE